MSRSTSNLAEALHGGRPKVALIYHCNGHHLDHHLDHHDHSHLDYYDQNEEAHVSRKKLRHGEKVELLVKVELVSLLIYYQNSNSINNKIKNINHNQDHKDSLKQSKSQ